jgi:hypothetical protein
MSELSPRARAILEEGRASDEPTEADKQRLRLKVAAALAEEPPAGEGPAVGLRWRRGRGGRWRCCWRAAPPWACGAGSQRRASLRRRP